MFFRVPRPFVRGITQTFTLAAHPPGHQYEAVAGSSHPIDQLITLVGLANTRELVGTYLEETKGLLETIGREKPARQIALLHSLKGTSFQLGLSLFSAQCGALETRLQESPGGLTPAEIAALASGFAESTPRLRRWLSTNAAKS